MTKKLQPHSSGVAHHLPNRTRLRIPKNHRNAVFMDNFEKSLKKIPNVKTVTSNYDTGSIIIEHEEHPEILNLIGSSLEGVANEVFEAMLEGEPIEAIGISVIGHVIYQNFAKLDNAISQATNNNIDLKLLLPIGFLSAGIYKASRTQGWLSQVPTFVLFYYAYDSFLKFHNKTQFKQITNNHQPEPLKLK